MVFEKVKEIIVDTISCDEDQVKLEANLKEDLGIDSLDATELSMALEEEYGKQKWDLQIFFEEASGADPNRKEFNRLKAEIAAKIDLLQFESLVSSYGS